MEIGAVHHFSDGDSATSYHVTTSQSICQRIDKRLDAWESGCHEMLVEETLRTCMQYLTATRRDEYKEYWAKTFHSLVLRGKLRTAVRWIME